MRVVLQRVSSSTVISNEFFNEIGKGYCLLVGVSNEDTEADAVKLAEKIAASRNFEDRDGKINLSIKDVGGEILSISQFTLYADTRDRKSTRLNSSHVSISYAVFCLKKKI